MSDEGESFLTRWSRRKALVREGKVVLPEALEPVAPPPAPVAKSALLPEPPAVEAPAPDRPPAPTLDDVAQLTRESDFRRFVAPDVDPTVRNAALKKLFADPQFNVMDGLDTYIDDYGKPDPLPASMLRKMVQSVALGLFEDEEQEPKPPAPRPPPTAPRDDQDPAVRLQPDDAAGPGGAAGGAGEDAGRER